MIDVLAGILISFIIGLVQKVLKSGPLPIIWYPIITSARWLYKRLNKADKSRQDLIFRGGVGYLFVVAIGLVLYFLISGIQLAAISDEALFMTSAVSIGLFISSSSILFSSITPRLSKIMRIDIGQLDDGGRVRFHVLISCVLCNIAFVTPVFWYYLLGIDGLLFASVSGAAYFTFSRFGQDKNFAFISGAIMRVLTLIPEIIFCAGIIFASIFIPGAKFLKFFDGLKTINHAPLISQGGILIHFVAYVAQTGLGGPLRDIDGHVSKHSWIGPSNVKAQIPGHKKKLFRSLFAISMFLIIFLVLFV